MRESQVVAVKSKSRGCEDGWVGWPEVKHPELWTVYKNAATYFKCASPQQNTDTAHTSRFICTSQRRKSIQAIHMKTNVCLLLHVQHVPYIFNIQGENAHWFSSTCENLPWDAHKLVQTSELISFKVDHVYFLGLLLFYGSVRTPLMHNHKKRKRPLGQSTSRNSCLLSSLISEQLQFRVLGSVLLSPQHCPTGTDSWICRSGWFVRSSERNIRSSIKIYVCLFYFLLNSEI